MTKKLNRVLALVLTIAALMTGQRVWAEGTWTVEVTGHDNNTYVTTFTITRSEKNYAQTVLYRTVGLSAYVGQHYTAVSGTLTFGVGDDKNTVTVKENTPTVDAYMYQNGTTERQYMLEITDIDGSHLADCTRTMTTGTSFSAAKVSKSITNLVYFSGSNYASGLNSSKYVDVSYTPPISQVETSGTLNGYVLIDDSYDYAQKAATVSTSDLISSTGATVAYLNEMDYKIAATVCFTEKERDDGYQFIQIVAGNGSASYDTGYDPNKSVNDPVNSVYKTCFELSSNSNAEGKQYFPHRYDYANKTDETNASIGITEFSQTNGKLWQQKFKSGYQATTSGSLIFDANVENITTRFDAGGDNDDTWGYKDLFVRMALIDQTAPTVLAVSADPGRHARGNTVYVSVAFSEIVTANNPSLFSNWGNLDYVTGSGTNVLTFSLTIPTSPNTSSLNITGITTTGANAVTDLAGNVFNGDLTADGICTLDASYGGEFTHMVYNVEYNCYEIADTDGLRELADYVNGGNDCYGLVFKMTNDIAFTYTTAWDDDTSDEHNFDGIGGHTNEIVSSKDFCGTFDGGGYTIRGLRIFFSEYKDIGLFGNVGSKSSQYSATVKDVTIADARITAWKKIGGIASIVYKNSTVSGCTVAGNVTVRGIAYGGPSGSIGGIAGDNEGTVTGCTSSVRITHDGHADATSFGGIVGLNNGSIENCTAAGVIVPSVNGAGAIVGNHSHLATALSGNTYHSSLVGSYTFNIGTGKYYTTGDSYSQGDQTGAAVNTKKLWLFDYRDNSAVIVGYAATYNSNSSTAYNAAHPNVNNLIVTLKGRTLYKDGSWNTLCLPFTVSNLTSGSSSLNGATAMELDTENKWTMDNGQWIMDENGESQTGFDATSGTLTLNFKSASSITYQKPYIIKWESGNNIFEPTFGSIAARYLVTLTASNTRITSSDGKVQFVGTDRPVALTGGDKSILYLGSGNTLYWPSANMSINAFRAYFQVDLDSSAPELKVDLHFGDDENTTNISNTDFTDYTDRDSLDSLDSCSEKNAWYALDGRKIANGQKPKAKGLYIHRGQKVVLH